MWPVWQGGGQWAWALTAGLAWASGLAAAAPETHPLPRETARPQDNALVALIRQLDADTLELRQQASEQLLAAGREAIAPLVAALPRSSAEVTMRGLAILKKLSQSPAADARRDARAALEKLARCDERSLAAQAAAVLKTQEPVRPAAFRGGGRVAVMPGGMRMFQIQMMNGPMLRRIVAHEDGQTIFIVESPDKGITVTINPRAGSKDPPTTIAAASPEELERKSLAAAAIYRRYMAAVGPGVAGGDIMAPGLLAPPLPLRQLEKRRSIPPDENP